MLHVEQNPVESALGNDLRHDVAAEAAPEANLQLSRLKGGFEGVALNIHRRSSLCLDRCFGWNAWRGRAVAQGALHLHEGRLGSRPIARRHARRALPSPDASPRRGFREASQHRETSAPERLLSMERERHGYPERSI